MLCRRVPTEVCFRRVQWRALAFACVIARAILQSDITKLEMLLNPLKGPAARHYLAIAS